MTIYFNKDYISKEKHIKRLEYLAKYYKHMANALVSNEMQEIFKKWQGKVYTKRLQTALQKIDKYTRIDTRFGHFLEFSFYDDRCFKLEHTNCKGEPDYEWVYTDSQFTVDNVTKSVISDNEMIVREDLAELMVTRAKYYQQKYEKITNQLFQIDDYLKEFEEIAAKFNEFQDKTDADIRAEFELNVQTYR